MCMRKRLVSCVIIEIEFLLVECELVARTWENEYVNFLLVHGRNFVLQNMMTRCYI